MTLEHRTYDTAGTLAEALPATDRTDFVDLALYLTRQSGVRRHLLADTLLRRARFVVAAAPTWRGYMSDWLEQLATDTHPAIASGLRRWVRDAGYRQTRRDQR